MTERPEFYLDTSKRMTDQDRFHFSCTPERTCFTTCCHDLNLVLTPYDILRLKNRLGLKSWDFLARYTSVHIGHSSGLPVVILKMEGADMKCPFLETDKGCTVYDDRPGACRTYPLARMSCRSRDREGVEEFYYIVREPDCLGFQDGKEWTVKEWVKNQGIRPYNEINDIFGGLLQAKTEAGNPSLTADQIEIFYRGCYDLDEFKRFFLEGPNLDRYMEPEEIIKKIKDDEVELLKYGMHWVKKKLFQSGCITCGGGCNINPT
ncbi:MAG: YkgJ family cysteine cluster protein [Dissulfurimicrobium sp.]|uniref:YkgJ family cysteine cluster protein n=1 Tax=Dissulfurimicrobium sp. TaxID=2022436 RepID=UPI00404A616F